MAVVRCPRCANENPETAKFCWNCGSPLPVGRQAEGERRVVTVLFCDVKGSTTLAATMDPEDWTEIINGAFAVLVPPITKYQGTIARLLGDAVLAFFGAPVAHEDDPERAIRAGLDMLHAVAGYREQLKQQRGIGEFDIRIGINTGLAVIGDVGTAGGMEYTAMGDAVNVAARLQAMAEPGSMLVSGQTLRLAPAIFEVVAKGRTALRGRDEEVEVFEIRGRLARQQRAREAVPLVGREREIGLLRQAVAEVRRGGGAVVSLIGDAGLGKTRLIEELKREWDAAAVPGQMWTEARGQSYEQSRSYGLFRQHLLAVAGASETDPGETIRERVAASLPEAVRADERAMQALQLTLAVEGASPAGTALEGQELRAEVFRLFREVGRALAACQAVLVFDDLQWSDAASADLLQELFALADEVPILLICSFRPDRQAASWKVKQKAETDFPHRYTEITLGPLAASEGDELLDHVLSGAALPAGLRAGLLDKAEGNPLFIEEIVRSLIEEGTIVREGEAWRVTREDADIRLPGSLQAVLAARIDRLEQPSKETLQAASVIGRTFLYRILQAIREAETALDRQLATLQRLELVREQAREPEREYAFRHALTQEAAYSSILQRKRRELHLRVAQALEALFADRLEEFAAIVAHHFVEAGDPRALRYLKTAGDRALRLYALEDAATHYRRAVDLVRKAVPDERELLTGLYEGYGRTLELRGSYPEAAALYQELERIGSERKEPAIQAHALSALATVHSNPTALLDPAKAHELLERGITLAREGDDRALLARLLWNRGQVGFWRGEPDVGVGALKESAAIAREIGAKEQLAYTLNALGQAYRETAELDKAEEVLGGSIALFAEVGTKNMQADSLSTLAFVKFYRGDYVAALASGGEAFRISDEIGNDWGRGYSLFTPAYCYADMGDLGKAIQAFEDCVRYSAKGGFYAAQVGPQSDLGLLRALCGDGDGGLARTEAACGIAEEKLPDWKAWAFGQRARVSVILGRLEDAARLLDQASFNDRTIGNLYMSINIALGRAELLVARGRWSEAAKVALEGRPLASGRGLRPPLQEFDWRHGEALRLSGDLDGATAPLESALAEARALGSKRMLWRTLASLADIAEARGEDETAHHLRAEAIEIVEGIAASLQPVGLSERFLDRPEVVAVRGRGRVAVGRQ